MRIAAGNAQGEPGRLSARSDGARRASEGMQEVQQIVAILPGSIKPDHELHRPMPLHDLLQPLAKLLITGRRLSERQLRPRRLQIVAEEASVMPIARRVDADADTWN